MKIAYAQMMLFLMTVVCLYSCRMEIFPLAPPKDVAIEPGNDTPCIAPSIEKNMINSWHFESTLDPAKPNSGTVVFGKDGSITDSNALFESEILNDPVTKKAYSFKRNNNYNLGYMLEIYLTTRRGVQTNYYTIVSNDCNKIHLRLYLSGSSGVAFVLTK